MVCDLALCDLTENQALQASDKVPETRIKNWLTDRSPHIIAVVARTLLSVTPAGGGGSDAKTATQNHKRG